MSGRALVKYLARHSEPNTQHLAAQVTTQYNHVLVVPAFDEPAEPINVLANLCKRHNALLILVVNAPTNADSTSQTNTQLLLQQCSHPNTLVIDHVSTPLPEKQGVGLARKIGSDLALQLISDGKVKQPWLYQTDADVRLPENYFSAALPSHGTVLFKFRHTTQEPALQQAIEVYETHMAYYVAGLRFAGSPYAYFTLGSTLAIHADNYAQVHGFPKRNAGEDFHVLNKLSKVGPIKTEDNIVVTIAARSSLRVPYGTGPALARIESILATLDHVDKFRSYNPEVFYFLKDLLAKLSSFAHSPTDTKFSTTEVQTLGQLGWAKVSDTLGNPSLTSLQRSKASCDWFDALRTLRCIHIVQQRHIDLSLHDIKQSDIWQQLAMRSD